MNTFGEEIKSVSDIVKDFIEAPYREESKEQSNFISPSGLGCPVAAAFKLTGTQLDPKLTTLYKEAFPNYGTHRHDEIQKHLMKSGWWINVEQYLAERPELGLKVIERKGNEVKVESEELRIHFQLDGIIYINNKYYILEIKTEDEGKWKKREGIDPKHSQQIITYSMLLNIPDVFMIYEARGTFAQKYFETYFTTEERENQKEYIKSILANEKTPWLLKRNSSNCVYCKYKTQCNTVVLQQQCKRS